MILLHRIILNAPRGVLVDHRNGDGLDNRRENLRLATHGANSRNNQGHTASSSQFKGVSWITEKGKWKASIRADGIDYYLGYFTDEVDAALAVDIAAAKHHGEFAYLNIPT